MKELIVFIVLANLYFTPTILAFYRQKANRIAILVVNAVFGLTIAGWWIALVWALLHEDRQLSCQSKHKECEGHS